MSSKVGPATAEQQRSSTPVAPGGSAVDRWVIARLRWATRIAPETWLVLMLLTLVGVHVYAGSAGLSAEAMARIGAAGGLANLLCTLLVIRSQRAMSAAVQLKLGTLIAATRGASNQVIGIEEWDEETMERLRQRLLERSQLAGAADAVGLEPTDAAGRAVHRCATDPATR
jgi:low affinity Fe/Cu permease